MEDARIMFVVELSGFADGLDVSEKKTEIKYNSSVSGRQK